VRWSTLKLGFNGKGRGVIEGKKASFKAKKRGAVDPDRRERASLAGKVLCQRAQKIS